MFFFLPSISPLALQSLSTDGVSVITQQLGEDILRCWGKGEEGKSERIEKGRRRMTECIHSSPAPLLPSALQSLHCTCATSYTPGYQEKLEGISMWLAIFSSHQVPPL